MNIEDLNNKHFDLFGSDWTIKLVDTLDDDKKDENNNPICHYGYSISTSRTIEISRKVCGINQPNNEMYLTVVHELVHAILDTGTFWNASGNEALVEFLTRSIISLLKQDILCK